MSRTVSNLQQDTPSLDGLVSLAAGADIVQVPVAAETAKMTRLAAGEFSLRTQTASTAYSFMGGLAGLIFRTGEQDDNQQAFGSARGGGAQGLPIGIPNTLSTASTVAGSPVNIGVLSSVGFAVGAYAAVDTVASGVQEFAQITAIPDATHVTVSKLVNPHATPFLVAQNLFTTTGGATGRPPFTGSSNLTPQTGVRAKGVAFKQLNVIYAVNTAPITVPTVGLFATQFINGVAPTVTTLIAQATNGLATAVQAQPYVIPVPVPVANQGFIITPNTIVVIEFDFTNGTTATAVDVIGFSLNCAFNYE
jgi:hypothetical protein